MPWLRHRSFFKAPSKRSVPNRLLALAVVVLFVFQLSRFYVTISLDPSVCFELNHQHALPSDAHHHHQEHAGEILPAQDGGFFFQHCKDTYDGMNLTPAQPFGLPSVAAYEEPATTEVATMQEPISPVETFLSPPFQPPRS